MNNVYPFWKRFAAFIIDSMILIFIGMILTIVFYNQLLSIGNYAVLVGFIIFVLYYGLQNSSICNGQTIGKRIFKIKVTNENGQYLTPMQSILRALILTPLLIFNSIDFPLGYISITWGITVFSLSLIQIILFLANKPTRQLLHDLIIKSICVNVNEEVQEVVKNKKKLTFIIGIITLLGVIGSTSLLNLTMKMTRMNMQEFFNLQQNIKEQVNANLISINTNYNKNFNTNQVTSSINYSITIPGQNIYDKKVSTDNMAKTLLVVTEQNNNLKNFNVIGVSIIQNINLGLFKSTRSYSQSGSLQQWNDYIKTNHIK